MSRQPNHLNLPPIQDMPPEGGYRKIDFGKYYPKGRGPAGWQLWLGASTMIMYGFYQVGQTNIAKNQQRMQERKVRYEIAPILQAEADREYLERELIILKKEAEIMKDVDGWVVGKSPYWTQKFMPRAVNQFDRTLK